MQELATYQTDRDILGELNMIVLDNINTQTFSEFFYELPKLKIVEMKNLQNFGSLNKEKLIKNLEKLLISKCTHY